MKNRITVLAFGPVTDVLGSTSLAIEDVHTTGELKSHLEQKFPALKNSHYAVAVNKQLITGAVALTDGATVALLPPFSGG